MVITCMEPFEIVYADKEGKIKRQVLRPGSHNYPMLDHKDPRVAEQLRVLRKHKRIGFDEILPSDESVLASMDIDEPNKAAKLLEKTGLQPKPAGRKVKGEKKVAKRNKKASRSPRKSEPETAADQSGREVSE